MKHLIVFAFVFVILVCTTELKAQNISDVPSNSFPFNLGGQTIMRVDNRYEGIKGSYTLLDEFIPGTIELTKGKFSNVLINYDAYTDNLLAKSDKIKDVVQMRKDMVVNFVISVDDEKVVFTKHTLNGIPTFLLNLVSDTISLYCKVSKTIKKADLSGAYNVSEKRYDEFITVNTYYVIKGKGDLQEVQKNKKGMLQAFPEFKDQLSDYLKHNKIDFNDYNQVKLVILFVNTLDEQKTN